MEFLPRRKSMSSLSLQRRRESVLSMDSSTASTGGCSSADEGMIVDSDNENDLPDTQPVDNRVLKDVVAYVEVRTKSENRSNSVSKQLELLGAVVVKKFTNDEPVTHVIWKDGKKSTKDKAIKRGLHLVSVLWVDSCKQNQQHAAESLFPVTDSSDDSSIVIPKIKRMKSMQPKTFEEELQSSTERIGRKRRKKELVQPISLHVNSPGAVSKPHVYVQETQDPFTPVGTPVPGVRGTPSLIPDTPASMRACLDVLNRVRNSCNTPTSGSEKPVIGESPTFGVKPDVLQKKLSFSPSVGANASGDETKGSDIKTADKTRVKKGRRSEGGQGSAKKLTSSKVRRLSLRIEKALSEQETDEENYKPKSIELANTENSESNTNQKNVSHVSNGSKDLAESRLNNATSKNVLFCEKQVPSHREPSVGRRRKRKLLSTNTDATPSQVLTEPTKSSKKDRQQKGSDRSGRSSVNLSDRFEKSKDLTDDLSKDRTDDTHQANNCNDDIGGLFIKEDDHSSKLDVQALGKASKEGRGRRKRKKEDLSPGSSEEETSKLAKRQKEDGEDVSLPAKTSHQQARGKVTANRRSLDEFAQKKRLDHLKAKRKLHKNRSASLSTLNPGSSKNAKDSMIKEPHKERKKASRSQSLTGVSATGGSGTKPLNKDTMDLGEMSDSSENAGSTAGVDRVPEQGRVQTVKPTKKLKAIKPSLVMTSVHRGDQDLITSVVKKLKGFSVEDDVSETTTHVVCGENRRTLNVLHGIARGCWLLTVEWVLKSLEAEQWLPEEPYEIHDAFPAAKMARLERCSAGASYKQDLFSSLGPIYIHGNTTPPKASLTQLVELCSGLTCSNSAQASLCVGGGRNQTGTPAVSEKWLLDCITQHKLLPVDAYLL